MRNLAKLLGQFERGHVGWRMASYSAGLICCALIFAWPTSSASAAIAGCDVSESSGTLVQNDSELHEITVTNSIPDFAVTIGLSNNGTAEVTGTVSASVGTFVDNPDVAGPLSYEFLNGPGSSTHTLTVIGASAGTRTVSITIDDTGSSKSRSINWTASCGVANASTTTTGSNATATYSPAVQSVALSATVTSASTVNSGTVTFDVAGVGTVTSGTVSGGSATANLSIPAGTAAGAYTITATYSGATGYAGSSDASKTLTINQASQTIGFVAPADQTFAPGGTIGLTSTGGASTSPVTFASNNEAVCTVSGETVTYVSAGTCSITASQAGDANYTAAPPVTDAFEIMPASQTISFTGPATATYGDAPVTVTASATSGLDVTLSEASDACSISGTTVTLLGAGNCIITASQAGDGNYDPADSVEHTIAIGKANQAALTVTATPNPLILYTTATLSTSGGSGEGAVTYQATSGSASCSIPVGSSTLTGTYPSTCTVTATKAADANYNAATATVNVTVQPIPTVTVAESVTTNYSTSAQTVTLQASVTRDGGSVPSGIVTFSVVGFAPVNGSLSGGTASASLNIPAMHAPGSYVITATYNGTVAYTSSSDATGSLTILSSDMVVSLSNLPATATVGVPYSGSITCTNSGTAAAINATCSAGGGPVGLMTTCQPATASLPAGGTKTCTVSGTPGIGGSFNVTGNTGASNDPTTGNNTASKAIVVGPGSQTISFMAPDDQIFDPAGTVELSADGGASGNPVTFASNDTDVCTVSGTTVTFASAGECSITASQEGNTSYNAADDVTDSFMIGLAGQTITFDALPNKTYGDAGFNVSATASSSLPVTFASDSTACSVTSAGAVTINSVGPCAITASQAGNANYNAAADVTQSFTIGKAGQAILFTAPADQTFAPGGTTGLSATGGASTSPVTFASTTPGVCTTSGTNGATVTYVSAGTCSITASQAGDENYSAADPVTDAFEINPAGQVISFTAPADQTFAPGGTTGLSATGGASTSPVTFASTTTGVCTTSGTNGATVTYVSAGTCSITASQAGDENYSAADPVTDAFEINPAGQVITFTSALPGAPVVGGTHNVTATGGASGNDVVFSTESAACNVSPTGAVTFEAVGPCVIEANQAAGGGYAAAAPVTQSFAVGTITLAWVNEVINGTEGETYCESFVASGGTAPYNYSFTGELPAGLSFGGECHISGVPEEGGEFTVDVKAVDENGGTTSQTFIFTIREAAPVTITISPATLPPGNQGVAYSQTLTASGGVPAYNFAVTTGALPAGLSLSTAGVISGTPTVSGTFAIVVTATDSNLDTGTKAYTLKVGTDFIEQRTAEVNRNFLSHRADIITSEEPDRARNHRRLRGGPNGQGAGTPGGSQFADTPIDLGMMAGENNGPVKFTFSTSLQQILGSARKAEAEKQASLTGALGAGPMSVGRMALGGANASYSTDIINQNFDFWIEGHVTRFRDNDVQAKGDSSLIFVGADYLLSPSMLVGVMAQFDSFSEDNRALNSSVSGEGWMIGPYVSARITDNVFFDGRVAWGESDNSTSPFGTYKDEFSTERWIARANLTGNWEMGAWRFTPSAGIAYFEDEQERYVDSNGIVIDGQKVSLGRFTFGPEMAYRYLTSDGNKFEPFFGIQGIWDFEKENMTASLNGLEAGRDDFRAKVQAGVTVMAPSGYTVRASGTYDGIGDDSFESYGGQVWINFPLN